MKPNVVLKCMESSTMEPWPATDLSQASARFQFRQDLSHFVDVEKKSKTAAGSK